MAIRLRNAKRKLDGQPRYLSQLRMDVELDQGYPLTTTQDIALEQIVAEGRLTVQEAADRLIGLRPHSKSR